MKLARLDVNITIDQSTKHTVIRSSHLKTLRSAKLNAIKQTLIIPANWFVYTHHITIAIYAYSLGAIIQNIEVIYAL